MAFYPHFSTGFYAYPMHHPMQDFYGMPMDPNATMFYDNNNMGHHHFSKFNKPGFNNRKISQDSGISDYSMASRKSSNTSVMSMDSRKTSTMSMASRKTSTMSNVSIPEEDTTSKIKEESETPLEIPSDEVCAEIVDQVEFYFSNVNITKDKFLLKHVKRNKEGFVSLKLISSFKRVKHLTKDWRQVAYAVEKKSDKLEVNDLKNKVRRKEALPEYDETTPSRTVVAMNLPIERPTIEAVAEMFSVCGEIVLARILRPSNPIPADVRPFVNKHPEVTGKVCALVEFEKTEYAMKAISLLNNEEEEKMKVMELTAPPPVKTGKKSEEKKKLLAKSAGSQPQRRYSQGMMPEQMMMMNNSNEGAQSGAPRRKTSLYNNMKFSSMAEQNQKGASLNPNAPIFTMQKRRMSRPSQPFSPHPAHFMMEPAFGMMHPMQPFPGFMSRRQMEPMPMPGIMRQPKGPVAEKGKGFQKWCRNRMEPAQKPGSRAVPIIAPPIKEETSKEVKKEMEKGDMDKKSGKAMPEIAIAPVVVALNEESGTSEDEGHCSEMGKKTEKAR